LSDSIKTRKSFPEGKLAEEQFLVGGSPLGCEKMQAVRLFPASPLK